MKLKLVTALGALALAALGVAAPAEDEIGQSVDMDGPGVAVPIKGTITAQQRKALYAPRGPRPGLYRLRSLHSGQCVWIMQGGNMFDRQDRPLAYPCNEQDPNRPAGQFAMIPHPDGGYTVRPMVWAEFNGRAPVPNQISTCLTVAPGVVLGPARIEARGCDIPNGAGWTRAGGSGQRFMVLQMAAGSWELQLAEGNPESPDCIAARGGSREKGTDYIKWGCNGNADQRFALEWLGPLPAKLEADTLALGQWFPFADGHYRLAGADGVDLSGAAYTSFETIDDKGEYCKRRCAELAECKAWTWTGPAYIGNDPAKCFWRSTAGNPINRGPRSVGKLISGIVRM